VLDTLAATDLFFGIALTILKKVFPAGGSVKQQQLLDHSYEYQRLAVAADHFIAKLALVQQGIPLRPLTASMQALGDFFSTVENKVRWVEFSDTGCVFFSRPIDIRPESAAVAQRVASLAFVDTSISRLVMQFTMVRLGLHFKIVWEQPPPHKPKYRIAPKEHTDEIIQKYLAVKQLPAALVFGGLTDVKHFYDAQFRTLKGYASVFAEKYSGGSNKITRNFLINPQSVLLATPQFLEKVRQRRLPVQTLVFSEVPARHSTHPYAEALAQFWRQEFPDYRDIVWLGAIQSLLKIFYSSKLETLVLLGETNPGRLEMAHELFSTIAQSPE
jgi:hypothetical protein